MRRGRAGRRDGVVDAVDLEPGGQRRRGGRGHRLRHRERSDALRAGVLAGDLGGIDDGAGRGTARAHDDAGALVGDVAFRRARHRQSPDPWRRGSRQRPWTGSARRGDRPVRSGRASGRPRPGSGSRASANWSEKHDARFRVTQRGEHLLRIVSDGRYDTQARDNDSSHTCSLVAACLRSGCFLLGRGRPAGRWPCIWSRRRP